jgi:hypothetical protein
LSIVYSCCKIANALGENLDFVLIRGNITPAFRTFNDFKYKVLKDPIPKLFSEVVTMLSEMGSVSLDVQYLDHPKIESVSKSRTFV